MNKLVFLSLSLSFLISCGSGESEENEVLTDSEVNNDTLSSNQEEAVEETSNTVEDFIPEGMDILEESDADLNLDGISDKVLVLKMKTEIEGEWAETERNVLILVGQENGSWKEKGMNADLVYCQGCGGVFGDPFSGIFAEDGRFTIDHYGGSADRWSRSITFEYNEGMDNWILVEDLETGFSAIEPDSDTSYNYYNEDEYGTALFDSYSIE